MNEDIFKTGDIIFTKCERCENVCSYVSERDSPGFIYKTYICKGCGNTHVIPVVKTIVDWNICINLLTVEC